MKLCNKFSFIFLCCLSMVAGAALTPEQQSQLNRKLIIAADNGDLPVAEQALADGADIHADDDEALRSAAKNGSWDMVQFLVEHGANVHADDDETKLNLLNVQLIDAAMRGDLPAVKQALNAGADIHAEDDTALLAAVEYGHLPVVKFLVEHGADIHAGNDVAFRRAALDGQLAMVQFLVKHGANIHAYNDMALQSAIDDGHCNSVVAACLLQHGADRTTLTVERQQDLQRALRTAVQVHNYILHELRIALSKNDWQAAERVLGVIPIQELPAEMQEQIEQLIVTAAEKLMPTLPLHVQERILSFMMGPITWHYFVQGRNNALAGNAHEII